jgi:hypothetical protein
VYIPPLPVAFRLLARVHACQPIIFLLNLVFLRGVHIEVVSLLFCQTASTRRSRSFQSSDEDFGKREKAGSGDSHISHDLRVDLRRGEQDEP